MKNVVIINIGGIVLVSYRVTLCGYNFKKRCNFIRLHDLIIFKYNNQSINDLMIDRLYSLELINYMLDRSYLIKYVSLIFDQLKNFFQVNYRSTIFLPKSIH